MRGFRLLPAGTVLALVILAVVGLAVPAGAHIQALTVDETATLQPDGDLVVHGTITCTAGENFIVRVNVSQPSGSGQGVASGVCTGESQQWVAEVSPSSGEFQEGRARVCAFGRTTVGGELHDTERTCEFVRVL